MTSEFKVLKREVMAVKVTSPLCDNRTNSNLKYFRFINYITVNLTLFKVTEPILKIFKSQLINLNSVSRSIVNERHKYAFFLSVETETHLVITVSNIAEPVSAVVLTHRSDQRA